MKGRTFGKVVAFALVMVMAFGSMAAFAGSVPATTDGAVQTTTSAIEIGGEVTGEAIVNNPVLEVVIPAELSFAIDPFELSGANKVSNTTEAGLGGQIASANFPVINKSNAHVNVTFDFEMTGGDGFKVVTKKADIDETKTTEKSIYFNAVAAKSADNPTTTGALTLSGLIFGTPNASNAAVMDISESAIKTLAPASTASAVSGSAVMSFLLAKAESTGGVDTDISTTTTFAITSLGAANIAAFKFYGFVNSEVQWKASDVVISAAYTIKAVSRENYDSKKEGIIEGTLNMIPGGSFGFAKTSFTGSSSTDAVVGLKLNDGDSIASFVLDQYSYTVPSGDYKHENDTFTLLRTSGVMGNGAGTYKMTLTTTNGKEYKINLIIT